MEQSEIETIIEEATRERGWISNSYAQIEFLLGDLIMRCREMPEYAQQTATFTHSAPKRVSKVRAMLNEAGPLSPYADGLGKILSAFEEKHAVRNLLAHGFCAFHYTADGDAGLTFRKFERGDTKAGEAADRLVERTFRLVDLQRHKTESVQQAELALHFFEKMHRDFGWAEI